MRHLAELVPDTRWVAGHIDPHEIFPISHALYSIFYWPHANLSPTKPSPSRKWFATLAYHSCNPQRNEDQICGLLTMHKAYSTS